MPETAGFAVVGIGASAGGLEACRKFVAAIPPDSGMAFILIQHLDPTHESMMVDLLKGYTSMEVLQASEGMVIEPEHFYIMPPGAYLAAGNGVLHLSQPQARHGARLPLDFFLHSLADHYTSDAIAVILSGTGTDGSIGLQDIKAQGGTVFVQDPAEAGFDGMPHNAIRTGAADFILPAADIPEMLMQLGRTARGPPQPGHTDKNNTSSLQQIIELLRIKTNHDFTFYKPGTLQRRIKRRMAMASIGGGDFGQYLEFLNREDSEPALLAADLLINVTSFFRDPKVFALLAKTFIPELLGKHDANEPLRIWVAGCSTGEEAYTLAILFLEAIAAAKSAVKLQIFASDIDADAVAVARDGLYPTSIATEVSATRLANYFNLEDHGYRVSQSLRSCVIFAEQDVLSDPPFSRLDFISCRNLMIYLQPEAQAKVIAAFHFALRDGGLLLLGSAETTGALQGRFEAVAKLERIYRQTGRRRAGEFGVLTNIADISRVAGRAGQSPPVSRQSVLSDLCRRLVLENYAPAAILINQKHECLYSLGATDRYLRIATGHPSHDLLTMVPPSLRAKLRTAVEQAGQQQARVGLEGGEIWRDGVLISFGIDVLPVTHESETLFLICFVDTAPPYQQHINAGGEGESPRIAILEHELKTVRGELQASLRNLEISNDEQKVINEEALSVNEEYQSTNEELMTSKEELQSLNEELTALNSQLQEMLERHRTTANDLQNILYSTDVATLFLDAHLNIRFFTPAIKSLFNIIPGDIGRPLTDLRALTADSTLTADALTVLRTTVASEREIVTQDGSWFTRRILPYRTLGHEVEGVVITFADITERKAAKTKLEEASNLAEQANQAKSRFLAATSHDLRQPLQTLALVHGLLSKLMPGEPARHLLDLLDQTADSMSGMLNTLLDINQIDAGVIQPEIRSFPINEILLRLRSEFTLLAQAQNLGFDVVPCSLIIRSDPRLLEQMIRNILSNALKYTPSGRVLLGCRRRRNILSIEIWDTGIGIPDEYVKSIFEEYYQLDNAARERGRGFGLGLAIVQRLGRLLGHHVRVATRHGSGSMFAIDVALQVSAPAVLPGPLPPAAPRLTGISHKSSVLIIEDDEDLRALLEMFLRTEGYHTATAADGAVALRMVDSGGMTPDLILADFNLPNGPNGLQTSVTIRKKLQRDIPVIVLTGDIAAATLLEIAEQNCRHLNKPVKLPDLTTIIETLLADTRPDAGEPVKAPAGARTIFIVDDDASIRAVMGAVFLEHGWVVREYSSGEEFLAAHRNGEHGAPGIQETCLLIDAYLPGISGVELLQSLHETGEQLPSIMITGRSDVQMAVQAMRAGALDFIEKPVSYQDLLSRVSRAIAQAPDPANRSAWQETAVKYVARLTARQRQIMELVIAGYPSKNIALDLGISQRTVENHRAAIMKKTESRSLPALARVAFAAGMKEARGF